MKKYQKKTWKISEKDLYDTGKTPFHPLRMSKNLGRIYNGYETMNRQPISEQHFRSWAKLCA
jgi:hypothetical protein